MSGVVKAFDSSNPAAPTAVGQVIDHSPFAAATAGFSVTGTATSGAPALKSIDIQAIVQELVNSYDYSNQAMVFTVGKSPAATFVGSAIAVYMHDQGATKDAQLVVDYTPAGPLLGAVMAVG